MAIQSLGAAAQPRPIVPDRNAAAASPTQALGRLPAAQEAQATPIEISTAVKKPEAAPSLEQVTKAVEDINKSLKSQSQNLEFSVDTDSKRTIVKIVDQTTKEVIRQIPSAEALEIAKALDTASGFLIKQQA
jgi:flagellar protein FlaG